MSALVGPLCLCLILGIVWWALNQLSLPPPVRMVAAVVLALLCIVAVLNWLPISLPHGRIFH